MPYLNPGSPGFLTADEIIRQSQMSRAGADYLAQLSKAATEARDTAMQQYRQRAADMYMQQHFPQFAVPGNVVNSPFYTARGRGHRGYGGAYYEAPRGYEPRVVAQGAAAPPLVPSNMAVVAPTSVGFTGPRSVEEVRYDQLLAGTAPEPLTYPGYMPVSHGFMYSGTKEGFRGAPDEE